MSDFNNYQKSDWFYEFRPILILLFGLFGILNQNLASNLTLLRVSELSGLVLIFCGIKICQWRYTYRKQRSHY